MSRKDSKSQPRESRIRVKVIPRSSKNQVAGKEHDIYKIKLTSPPIEGKANEALIALLAGKLRIPKKSVEIISGKRSRLKNVRIVGLSEQSISSRLKE